MVMYMVCVCVCVCVWMEGRDMLPGRLFNEDPLKNSSKTPKDPLCGAETTQRVGCT
jgi:hypothetical protein